MLAKRYGGRLVPEVARSYLQGRDHYDADDLLEIARLQVAAEAEAIAETAGEADGLVVCDTDLLVIRVWWEEKFGPLPGELIQLEMNRSPRAYLLTRPDLPWQPDPLRENPTDRARLFQRYLFLLDEGPHAYAIVEGRGDDRTDCAHAALDNLLPGMSV